jgi:hypothetical protein
MYLLSEARTNKVFYRRSIKPTVMALLDPQGAETLRQNREKLSSNITELINEYGPKVFTDFDGKKNSTNFLFILDN